MVEMTGGCLCGQVRYSANAEPAFVGVCHCTHCQKQTGTAFSVLVGVPKSAMKTQGRLKIFHDKGDSGQPVERSFCPECGSPIFSDVAVVPGVAFIKAGTLDDTTWLEPKVHVYCDSAERWTHIPEPAKNSRKRLRSFRPLSNGSSAPQRASHGSGAIRVSGMRLATYSLRCTAGLLRDLIRAI